VESRLGFGILELGVQAVSFRFRAWYEHAILTETPGLGPTLARAVFRVLSWGYGLAVGARRAAYAAGFMRVARPSVPVFSVGNLAAGGTGKTPAAVWLCRRLVQRGLRVALLARGYGRTDAGGDDEAPPPGTLPDGAVRLAGPDRAGMAVEAAARFGSQAVVLDDGFQHWRLARDFDLVCIDAMDPFGNERLLPAGPLREPPSALSRATAFLLTRTDLCTPEEMGALRARMRSLAGGRPVAESVHRPVAVIEPESGRERPVEWLRGRRVYAFCGIGSPRGFRRTLAVLGADVARLVPFPDHHRFSRQDLDRIVAGAKEMMAETLVTTEKDAARLAGVALPLPLHALRIELEVTRGAEALDAALDRILGKKNGILNSKSR
jgi:tetraacyldisaccharide 4'-kinase